MLFPSQVVALEATRLQDEHFTDGDRIAVRDLLIEATARSTGDHLVIADSDFQTDALESTMQVTNLREECALSAKPVLKDELSAIVDNSPITQIYDAAEAVASGYEKKRDKISNKHL
ncbi:hypothetical protein Htur_4799 (plasmid) [Haloterrigena turkmenica DSM 5511]|uniref:PIN domain-containing protein n=1 Tax=Haloterrigena turkmenica (strain ATCC 51198 / DSM 5511 / JCM 9101 / NCIMB 13204 / VKM B-1734 / 4k) TaxID=543526 RepID=D2S2H2_HALTV|nr:hypothetical protein [Haloterrigena turkmenica]ADB63569.1 hypothetical protein Htur_4799 [Haloterrigena turkmenica DSM 5511]